ncbi:MAG: YicC family protein [Bacteroidales bacterium]|nr:YicC family protein [Bacteroidales bacterium]
MIQSMTGYGKSVCDLADKTITIEIKSLNSKQMDIYTRLPNLYKEKDLEIRNEISSQLKRGKAECLINLDHKEAGNAAVINASIVKNYYNQLKSISDELAIDESEPLLSTILRLPDSLRIEKEELNEEEWQIIFKHLKLALNEVNKFRDQEGIALNKDITERMLLIENYLDDIQQYESQRIESLRLKIAENLKESVGLENIDQNRFEQELIYYLEKIDITEEKVRLKNHCEYFRQVIAEPDPVGKKLNFISQEIGREINTIGSKANHSDIQRIVVMMKDELEKVKEQLLNIL